MLDHNGSKTIPAVVTFEEDKDGNERQISGQEALDVAYRNSTRPFSMLQSMLSTTNNAFASADANTFLRSHSKRLSIQKSVDNKIAIKVTIKDQVVEKYPEDIVAVIIRHLKERAQQELNAEVSKVIITIPAYYSENKQMKDATIKACELAGFNHITVIDRPKAVLAAYGLTRVQDESPQKFIMIHLGGNSLAVCLLNRANT